MSMNNLDIRKKLQDKRIRYYELAAALQIHPCTLSHWMATEMSKERKAAVLKAIKSIK